MSDPVKTFEKAILRPLQVILLFGAVVAGFQYRWAWLGGAVAGLFYLGVVGSKLHPMQSASQLARGPLEGPAAREEAQTIPLEVKNRLVSHACTRVGILVACFIGALVAPILGWPWYAAIGIGLMSVVVVGGALKVAFRPERPSA